MKKGAILIIFGCLLCTTTILAQQKLIFPDDTSKFATYVGKKVVFEQQLIVVDNYSLDYGRIYVAPHRLIDGTEVCEPGSATYKALVAENDRNKLKVSGNKNLFLDENGTLRTGSTITNLTGTLRQSGNTYYLSISETPTYSANERPTQIEGLGDYNVKVCSFNMEYYLRDSYGTGYGPDDEDAADRQHSKLLQALVAIDADVYGLLEVQQGQEAVAYMCDALNEQYGSNVYAYVSDGTAKYSSYTKTALIYRKDRVEPFGAFSFNNSQSILYRKMLQGFKLLSNGETFILSLNHLKSKSGSSSATGDNADQGDGQGAYNATRVAEAQSVVSTISSYSAKYSESDVLVMGDMNAHSQEDPLMVFKDAGYYNMLRYHLGDEAYSYSYNAQVGLLDHILANSSMSKQISGVAIFHINADEPGFLEYSNASTCVDDMYRCSDHDAVVVGLALGDYTHSQDLAVTTTEANAPYVVTLDGDARIAICNAEGYDYLLTDVNGRVLTQGTLDNEPYNYLNPAEFGCNTGCYILRLTGNTQTPTALKFFVR